MKFEEKKQFIGGCEVYLDEDVEKLIESNTKLRELLIKAEIALDNHNADYGTKDIYCLCCGANEYDAVVGVVHSPDCLIIQIRSFIIKEVKQ